MLRYSIAFFQWRKKFNKPPENMKSEQERADYTEKKMEQLVEVFESKINFIRKYSKKLYKLSDKYKANALTVQQEAAAAEQAKQTKKEGEKKKKKVSESKKDSQKDVQEETIDLEKINHLHEIGWMYPKEYQPLKHYAGENDQNNIVRKEFDDLVYD